MIVDNQVSAEEVLNNIVAYCHLFPARNTPFSYCGVPRQEQEKHNGWVPANRRNFCPVCGLRPCEQCLANYKNRV